jgi:oligopeptide/dipeptide ABC transporter ATP-binding protein
MSDLAVEDLTVAYALRGQAVRAVDGVSFRLAAGEALGIVGESGSGKSTLALALAGLFRPDEAIMSATRLQFGETDLRRPGEGQRTRILGRRIGFVFQNPQVALNPVLTIGRQMTDHIVWHLGLSATEARARAAALLEEVGIADTGRRLAAYPHEFSGGMLQRVTIAMALACDPELLIADEPTTALDASIQADIVDLVAGLRARRKLSLIWITHDLALLAHLADRVAVMYAGRLAELGPAAEIYARPRHPYTAALLGSIRSLWEEEDGPFRAIEGAPPSPAAVGAACAFRPRCPLATARCAEAPPLLGPPRHGVACWVTAA